MKKKLCLLLFGGVLATSVCASHDAVKYNGIIAKVNGDIITSCDLDDQVKITRFETGVSDTIENRKEILKNFIIEKIKWKYIKKLEAMSKASLVVSDKEVDEAFARVAKSNNLSVSEFSKRLVSFGINEKILKQSMRVNITWVEYIKFKYRKHMNVSEKEVVKTLNNIKARRQNESFYIGRMFFPIIDSTDSKSVANRVEGIRRMVVNGANFGQLARKFSKSPDAKNGGDLGWVYEDQLSSEEYNALKTMRVGQVSVVKNSRGFYLLQLKDKRRAGKDTITKLQFVQVGVPLAKYAGGQDTKGLLVQMRQHYPSAKEFIKQAKILQAYVSEPVSVVLEGLEPNVRDALENCAANSLSRVVSNDRAHFVFCVLDRHDEKIPDPTLDDIRNHKLNEKFSVFSDKELYDLTKKADVNVDSKYGKASDFV